MSEKTTIAELKDIMVKVQVPVEDYTVIQPGLIIGGMSVSLTECGDVVQIVFITNQFCIENGMISMVRFSLLLYIEFQCVHSPAS